ncbi:MAG TPA: hypothetical protein DDW28_08000 [Prevotella sp.]|nr:hypothetical protein [Candidatus Segatella violae]
MSETLKLFKYFFVFCLVIKQEKCRNLTFFCDCDRFLAEMRKKQYFCIVINKISCIRQFEN